MSDFCRLRRNERYGVCDDVRQGGSVSLYCAGEIGCPPSPHLTPSNQLYQPKKILSPCSYRKRQGLFSFLRLFISADKPTGGQR